MDDAHATPDPCPERGHPALRRLPSVAFVLGLSAALAQAQTYPSKPIRIAVPVATGGIADHYSRFIGTKLTEAWGQPVVVENRAGGGGNISADLVAKAAPDGYTLVMGFVGPHAVNNWIGLFAPAGTPPEIVRKLNTEVMRIMQLPEVKRRSETEGERHTPNTPEQFAQFQRAEIAKWGKVIKDAGIKAD